MNKLLSILFLGISLFIQPPLNCFGDETGQGQEISLHACRDEKLGVRFLCNPDWPLETQDEMIFMVVSHEPLVTITIAKSGRPVSSLEQLTMPVLQEMGQYADGFRTEVVLVAGKEAVHVDGFTRESPRARLSDYYLLRDSVLYSILFHVSPEDQWSSYKELFPHIRDSVEFLK